jgi:hypothetical protein
MDAQPALMARRITDAIENGDSFVDADWTPQFKEFRALLLARMRTLPMPPEVTRANPLAAAEREALITEFLKFARLRKSDDESAILAAHCLDYTCDYLGEGAFRWSPIVVEMFLTDYVP